MFRQSRRMGIQLLLVLGLVVGHAGSATARGEDAPTIAVGSLSFTESVILSEILSLLLEEAGYSVERHLNLGTSVEAHAALVNGEIDMYVEYTGGGLVAILGMDVPTAGVAGEATPAASIAEQTHAIVSEQYRDMFGLVWLDEIGFNNSYALAVTAGTAEDLDLATISDLIEHAGELTLGTDLEFPQRQDGLPGLEAAYGIAFANVMPSEPGLMYDAIANGEVDVITAYTTEGRLADLDLVLLEDDLKFFPHTMPHRSLTEPCSISIPTSARSSTSSPAPSTRRPCRD